MAARSGESIGEATASIKSALAVDPSAADVALSRITRGIYVGVSGNLAVQFSDDADASSVVLTNLVAGVWHPMQVQKVLKTGTTATGIFAGF